MAGEQLAGTVAREGGKNVRCRFGGGEPSEQCRDFGVMERLRWKGEGRKGGGRRFLLGRVVQGRGVWSSLPFAEGTSRLGGA